MQETATDYAKKMEEAMIRDEASRVVRAPHLMSTPATDAFRSRATRGNVGTVIAGATSIAPPQLMPPVGNPPIHEFAGTPAQSNGPAQLWHKYLQQGPSLPSGGLMNHRLSDNNRVQTLSMEFAHKGPEDNNRRHMYHPNRTLAQELVNPTGTNSTSAKSPSSAPTRDSFASQTTWRKYLQ